MDWPYHLVDLSPEQRQERRVLLDRYGVYGQLSPLVPILAYQLYRLAVWVSSERQRQNVQYDAVPSSPRLKHSRLEKRGGFVTTWRGILWWLGGESVEGWGERGPWIAGMVWMCWLLFLCVHKTGDDYLHITKRFGVIAASQFPLHYMLSMKSLYAPLALVFQTSHEHLNTYHRISGRLLYTLLLLHGTWYINFFIQAGLLSKRLTSLVVWIGIIAFFGMTILVSASLQAIRRWSYRLFFISHLLTGIAILPLLFFHASPLRLYVTEALALFIFDILCRKLDTTTAFTTITSIPRTSLIRLSIPIPYPKIQRFKAAPGQHVYLSIPQNSVPTSSSSSAPNPHLYEFLFNPFTVASVTDTEITLVIRSLSGPTTLALSHLSQLNKAKPPMNIEGPLGSSKHFPDFATEFDRVLLIAGGVGATFILPLYQDIQTKLVKEMRSSDRIKLVWCMRDISEASWALPELGLEAGEGDSISLHVTGSGTTGSTYNSATDGSVELENVPSQSQRAGKAREGQLVHSEGRPDLRRAVDEMFRHGGEERVAVLVCGPHGMAREVRRHVGRWVEKGREVWWHDESFGW